MSKYRRIRRHDKCTHLAGKPEEKGLTSRPRYRWEHNRYYKNGVGCNCLRIGCGGSQKDSNNGSDPIKIKEFLYQLSDHNDCVPGC
jgi:hypothetical protein